MPKNNSRTPKPDDPAQLRRFKDLAEKFDANGPAGSFADVVRKVATSPRIDSPKKKPKK